MTRAGQGATDRGLSFSYEFLGASVAGKQMTPNVGTLHARQIHGPQDFARHAGEEFVYVFRGALEVHFESGDKVELSAGDSIYFDSHIGHAYISTSRKAVRVIGAVTTESNQMLSAREAERHTVQDVPTKKLNPKALKMLQNKASKRDAGSVDRRSALRPGHLKRRGSS